jgi:hypothetical protein
MRLMKKQQEKHAPRLPAPKRQKGNQKVPHQAPEPAIPLLVVFIAAATAGGIILRSRDGANKSRAVHFKDIPAGFGLWYHQTPVKDRTRPYRKMWLLHYL